MKSKLRPEQIIEIGRICIERFGKSPTSLFRCWCNDVVLKLISATDKVVFNAVLSHEFATPDCDEWRKKHEISLHDIEDELLLANSESIQPLNEIKVKWLKEWFADHADIGGDIDLTIAVKMMESADTPQKCRDAITFIHSKRTYIARYIKDYPGMVDNVKDVYNQMKNIVADCGGFRGRCESMVKEFGRTVFPDERKPSSPTNVAEVAKGSTLTPDYEKLRAYFKPGFMGMGEGSFNYFDEYLRKDLNTISKKNEMGMVAYLVYHGEHFKNKTMKFADWLRVFFSIVGVELPKNLAMSRYKPNGKISSLFRYL